MQKYFKTKWLTTLAYLRCMTGKTDRKEALLLYPV